ncbi:MAG TPA: hypothetical protein VMV92_31485 [Streptosporangiaceae bacterium]|nr:hypothetical protein [Streptosporangiaceae bacterium]
MRDEGIFFLAKNHYDPAQDLLTYLMTCPSGMVPTVIEAMSAACNNRYIIPVTYSADYGDVFDLSINNILREHRISYELISHQLVEFSSMELHQEVVAPTLRLLAGRPDLAKVETAYTNALNEISDSNPPDAITDAGTALQEMLTSLGCSGNSLGSQIKSAREKGILAAHDSPLGNGIEKILNWVSADRSEKGDSHAVRDVTVDDAWLIVHVVGALILRLSRPGLRVAAP